MRCALSPASERGVVEVAASMTESMPKEEGARGRPRSSGACRRRRRGRRGGRGCRLVVELLLRAEQRVEHLVAQTLAHAERDRGADDAQEQQLAETEAPPALLGARA